MRKMMAVLLAGGLFGFASATSATTRSVISRATDFDIPTLARLAQKGEVAFIETTPEGRSRQVIMLAVLPVPPERVWDAIMDVQAYPRFLQTVVEIDLLGTRGDLVAFDWEVEVPFFNLRGTRLQRGRRPSLVETRGHRGHLRGSRERWELFPLDDGARTLAAFYRAIDVDTGGILLKTIVELEPSMEQGANLSTGFVHMRGLAAYLAGRTVTRPGPRSGPVPRFRPLSLNPGAVDLGRLRPLLARGQLALVESEPDGGLRQAALLTLVKAPRTKLVKVIQDPARYPEFIPNFAEQKVTPTGDGRLRLEWELEVPIVNLDGVSFMTIEPDGSVEIEAHTGDIRRGRWRWEAVAVDDETTVPIHYTYSDVRDASWVTRRIIDKQPLFEHGIVLASATVALTAMKARAEGYR